MRVGHRTDDPGAFDRLLGLRRRSQAIARLLCVIAGVVDDAALLAVALIVVDRAKRCGLDHAIADVAADLVVEPVAVGSPDPGCWQRCVRMAIDALAGDCLHPVPGSTRVSWAAKEPVWARTALSLGRRGPVAFFRLAEAA